MIVVMVVGGVVKIIPVQKEVTIIEFLTKVLKNVQIEENLPNNITNATAYWDCGFGDTEVKDNTSINWQSFGTNFAPVWVGDKALKSNMSKYGEDI